MAYNEKLLERIRIVLASEKVQVEEKKMFGGVAFMLNSKMCCGIVKNDLMLRVKDEKFDDLLKKPNVRPMDFTKRPMRGFVFVNEKGWNSDAVLKQYLQYAIEYGNSAEVPKSKAKKKST